MLDAAFALVSCVVFTCLLVCLCFTLLVADFFSLPPLPVLGRYYASRKSAVYGYDISLWKQDDAQRQVHICTTETDIRTGWLVSSLSNPCCLSCSKSSFCLLFRRTRSTPRRRRPHGSSKRKWPKTWRQHGCANQVRDPSSVELCGPHVAISPALLRSSDAPRLLKSASVNKKVLKGPGCSLIS